MRDLSREEKLEQQIRHLENINGERKWIRTKKTFFVLSPVVYLIAFMSDGMNCARDYLEWIILAPIFAGLIIFISTCVTLYMATGAMSDEKYLARLKGELDAIKFSKYDKE